MTDDEILTVWNNMPGGPEKWLKNFGFLNFARRVLEADATKQAQRVPLTWDEIRAAYVADVSFDLSDTDAAFHEGARFAERHHGIKEQNNGR